MAISKTVVCVPFADGGTILAGCGRAYIRVLAAQGYWKMAREARYHHRYAHFVGELPALLAGTAKRYSLPDPLIPFCRTGAGLSGLLRQSACKGMDGEMDCGGNCHKNRLGFMGISFF